jgi:Mlc titration factor MtfA (ptsG expression regulator)
MPWFPWRRRADARSQPLPAAWAAILERNVPYHRALPAAQRAELERLTQAFVARKNFEGAGGLAMTDEIRVTIAAQACLLLLGRETRLYPELQSVIVYPEAYVAPDLVEWPEGTVSESLEERTGESWGQGAVVLSWDEVLESARDPHDGYNVVFHEFAHQLDEETGDANGIPVLPDEEMIAEWARVFTREYETLVRRVERGGRTVLDEYAAESPAEFFAVVSEYFFELPGELRARHAELYRLLQAYYRQDPGAPGEAPGSAP